MILTVVNGAPSSVAWSITEFPWEFRNALIELNKIKRLVPIVFLNKVVHRKTFSEQLDSTKPYVVCVKHQINKTQDIDLHQVCIAYTKSWRNEKGLLSFAWSVPLNYWVEMMSKLHIWNGDDLVYRLESVYSWSRVWGIWTHWSFPSSLTKLYSSGVHY